MLLPTFARGAAIRRTGRRRRFRLDRNGTRCYAYRETIEKGGDGEIQGKGSGVPAGLTGSRERLYKGRKVFGKEKADLPRHAREVRVNMV